jgi:hypothetical protein
MILYFTASGALPTCSSILANQIFVSWQSGEQSDDEAAE